MCRGHEPALTFETLLCDPLIRLVMDSDGVTIPEMIDVLETARLAIVRREAKAYAAVVG